MKILLVICVAVSHSSAKREDSRWADFSDYGSRSYSERHPEVDENSCSWCGGTFYSDEVSASTYDQRSIFPSRQEKFERYYNARDSREDNYRRDDRYTTNKRHVATTTRKNPNEAASDWYPLEHFHYYTDDRGSDDYHDPVYADLPVNVRFSRKLPDNYNRKLVQDNYNGKIVPDVKKVATGYIVGPTNNVEDKTLPNNGTGDKASVIASGKENGNSSKISEPNDSKMMNDKEYQIMPPGQNPYAWKSPGNSDPKTPGGQDHYSWSSPAQNRPQPQSDRGNSYGDRDRGSGGTAPEYDRGSGNGYADRDRGSSYADRDRGTPDRDRDRGTADRDRDRGTPDRDRDRGTPDRDRDRDRDRGAPIPDRDRDRGSPYADRGKQYSWSSPGWRSRDTPRDRDPDRDRDRGRDRDNPWKQPDKRYPETDNGDRFSSWKDRDDEGPVTNKQPDKETIPAKLSDSPNLWKDREVRYTTTAIPSTSNSTSSQPAKYGK